MNNSLQEIRIMKLLIFRQPRPAVENIIIILSQTRSQGYFVFHSHVKTVEMIAWIA